MPPDQARRLIVTVDGPAGAGKSTLAKRLARRLDLLYLDSGAFYRAVALMAGQHQGDLLSPEWLSSFLATFQLRVSPGPDGLKPRPTVKTSLLPSASRTSARGLPWWPLSGLCGNGCMTN